MKRILVAIALVCLVIVPASAQPKDTDVARKQLELGSFMLSRAESVSANTVVSPYSIHSALMLLRLGARGEIAAKLDQKLLPSSFSTDLQTTYGGMNSGIIVSNDLVTSALANSLWLQDGLAFTPQYVADTKRVFSAEPHHVNYKKSEAARGEINSWVASKTNKLIPELLPQGAVTPLTTCTLVNALYFKASWLEPFKKEETKEDAFWINSSSEARVPMMYRSDRMGYFEDAEWQAAHLAYAAYDYAFVVLVPKKRLSTEEIAGRLSVDVIARATEEREFSKVNLTLPRFKVRQGGEILPRLEAYGLTGLERGDYSGISTKGVGPVSNVIHEAVVSVDEAGTEAAAATAIMMLKGAFPQAEEQTKEVKADHPFAFVLMHRPTRAPLFMGIVGDPR